MKSTEEQEIDTNKTPMVQQNKTPEGSEESHTESFGQLPDFLKKDLLESMNVLNESVTLLHSQTKRLLKEPESEVRTVPEANLERAREIMATTAHLIQTKVNYIKALR